jgi:hypothetical protein
VDERASLSVNSLEIARRLLAREAPPSNGGDPKAAAVALERAYARVAERLRDSMGEEGHNALLARALAHTEASHPVLKSIHRRSANGIQLDGVAASVEINGVPAVTGSIEALLAAVLDILGRLIGEDMAVRIIDQNDGKLPGSGDERAR